MSSVTLTNEQFAQLLQQIGRGGGAATVKSELPKFDGDDEQWTSFRDLYESYYASCEQKELLPETQAKYDQLGPNDRKQQRSQLAFHLNQSIVRTTGGVSKAQEIIQSVEDAKKSDGSWLWLQLVNYYDPRREQQKAKDIDAYEDFKLASGDVAKELARYEGAVRKCEAAGQAIGEVMKVNKFKRLLHGLPEYRVFLEIIASETSTAGWDVFKQRLLSASDNAKAAESAADSSTVAALRHKPPSVSPRGERGQGQARGGAQGGPSRFRKEGAAPAQGPDGCWYCGKHKDKWFACKKLKRDIRDNRVDWSQSPYGKEPFGFQRFPNRLRAATVNAVQDEGDEDAHYTVAVVRAVDEPVVSPGGSSGVQATSPVQQSMGSGAPKKVASDARPGPHSVLSKEKEDDFMVDSGSDKHITWDESKLPDLKQCDNRIETADGTVVNADGIGTLTLQTSGGALVLRGVLLCRSIQHNIISSGRLGKEGKRFLVNYYDPRREQQKAKDIDAYEDFKLASGDVAKELARYEGAVRKCEAAGQAIGEVMKVNKFKRLLHGLPEYRVFLEIIASETSTAGWDVFKQRLLSASDNAKAAESAADSSTVAALRHKPPSVSPRGERGQGQARGGAQGGPSRFRKEGAAPAQGPDGCWYCGKHKDKWFACKKLKRDIRDNRVDWSQSPYGKEPFGFQRFANRLRAATVNAVQDEGDEDAHYTVAVVRAVDEPVLSPGGSSGVQATSPVQQSMGSGAPNKVASDARPGPHSGQNGGQVAKGRQTEAGEQEPTPVCQLLSVNRCSSVLSKEKEDDFMVDSGSDKHITWDESKLPDLKQCDNCIETADGTVVNADGIGTHPADQRRSPGRLGKEGKRFVHDTHKKDQSFIEDCNSGHMIQLVDKGIKAYLRETEQPTQHVCETTTTSPSGSASREGAGDDAGLKRGCVAPGAASNASRNDRQGSERRAGPSPGGGGKAGPLAGASTHQGSVPPPKTEQMSEAKTHAVSACGDSCRVERGVAAPLKSTEVTYQVVHNRLHVSDEAMKEMARSTIGFQQPSSYPKENYCQPCVDGDLPRKRRGIDRTKSAKSNDVWYADFEPMKESQRGHKGYLIVRDDASGFSCVSLMRNKAEAGQALERVIQVMGNKPKELRSDQAGELGGGELAGGMLARKCRELGIRQRFSASHEQHQNGPVERKVGIVKAKVKKLVSMSGMPDKLWPHAVGHAVWLTNRTPSKPLTHPADGRSMTPYEAYHGKKPNMSTLRAFGCHTSIRLAKQGVMEPKGRYGYYLGPDESGVRDSVRVLLHSTGKVVSGRSFTCNERRFPWLDQKEGREPFFSTWAERGVEVGTGAPPAVPEDFPPIIAPHPPPPPPAQEPVPPAAAPAEEPPADEQEGAEGELGDGGDDHHQQQQQLPQPPQMGVPDEFAADDEQEDEEPRRSGRERRPPKVYEPEEGTWVERQQTNALTAGQKVAKWKSNYHKHPSRHAQYLAEHSIPPGEGDAVYKRAQLASTRRSCTRRWARRSQRR
ncbi:unnamed protein product [Vitrella brassicaformis CCMP3155]|uniref:Integrase catalytic domain-containing protein n=2 Tax=Vitrella brassicaformis TaxID=1169539 RepID=A0A0G4F1P7_VITBC|nr:unnamed protein product [Vitrella brassicaformis CCMP3155]|eukprot:CEM05515.1 unnamed protein product [Vitrella brassicaformis CCMP3155]